MARHEAPAPLPSGRDPAPPSEQVREALARVPGVADPTHLLESVVAALHETIIFGFDADGTYLFNWCDPELERRYGVSTAAMVGTHLEDYFPDDGARRVAQVRRALESGEPYREVYSFVLPSGVYWHDMTIAPMRDAQGRPVAVLGVIHDVTERMRAEESRREGEALYRAVVEQATEGIVLSRGDSILFANPAAAAILGLASEAELVGRSLLDFVHPDSRQMVLERLATGDQRAWPPIEVELVTADGRAFWAEGASRPVTVAGEPATLHMGRDVTERRRAEEERRRLDARLLQAQKQESLLVLAGGVAHDFNNLLVGVLGHVSLAATLVDPASPVHAHLRQIETAALRAADLTRQLVAFSGGAAPFMQPADLGALVSEMAGLIRVQVRPEIDLQIALSSQLTAVRADVTQLRQVIMNLLLNAAEAVGHGAGAIMVHTTVTRTDSPEPPSPPFEELPPGDYVVLEVKDTGRGIDPAIQARIFDPFFSTKEAGRGLGLAAVAGIVRAHGGAIQVASEPGRGTRFRVLLPAAGGRN